MIVSDYMGHDKFAVSVFNECITENLNQKRSLPIKKIDVFSDGAAQHFKQRFNFVNTTLSTIPTDWHFFATSHGKGAVDGIGGTVKRVVQTAILTRRAEPTDAKTFASCAELLTNINIIYVSKDKVESSKQNLNVLWADILALPSTHNIH